MSTNRTEPAIGHRPRIVSGMQPTAGSLHLGNYLGALQPWVKMQHDYEAIFFVPDLHTLTQPYDPAELRERTRTTVAQYIAGGIDPDECILFVQSHVPEHTQLAWVMDCLAPFGQASRMTQFKDKSARGDAEASTVGLLAYPMLMAADILLYQPEGVPVGDDQRQHIELARDLAEKFNRVYGETFVVPQALIQKEAARIYDLQEPTKKMSKSAASPAGRVNLLDEPKTIAKRFKSAVTDDGTEIRFDRESKPGVSNLLEIYSALSGKSIPELEAEYEGKMYGHLKVDLAEVAVEVIGPVTQRTRELLDDPSELDAILARGAEKARAIAAPTLEQVYDRMGLLAPSRR